MANIYSWRINRLVAKIHEDGLDNVVFTVYWIYKVCDEDDEEIQTNEIGTLGVIYNPDDPFIPYENLTKDDVVGWLNNGLDVDAIKERCDKKIDLIKNPVDEYFTPDWD
tara:strand:- start:515 stop:841 length:327 start_codon:yes stop_codon:yes gene_type:complete